MERCEIQVERGETIGDSFIILRVDPRIPARTVATLYSKTRREFFGGAHYRKLGDKHKALAAFSREPRGARSLAERMAQWNARHPEWSYGRTSNFSRDMNEALRHEIHGTTWASLLRRTENDGPDLS